MLSLIIMFISIVRNMKCDFPPLAWATHHCHFYYMIIMINENMSMHNHDKFFFRSEKSGTSQPPHASGMHPNSNTTTSTSPGTFLSYVPYKFDPLFVEDPLAPGNNVGRNCFRVLQVQRSWSEVYTMMTQQLRLCARDGAPYPVLEVLVGKLDD